jgi:SP family general alpha glucoside:H+ symporter-like MFS transporter
MASARVVADIAPMHSAAAMDEKDIGTMDDTKALERMLENARSATEKEHKMTLMQGIRLYPKAIFWSVLISSTIIMV